VRANNTADFPNYAKLMPDLKCVNQKIGKTTKKRDNNNGCS